MSRFVLGFSVTPMSWCLTCKKCSINAYLELGVAHVYNPSTQEAESEDCYDFGASLGLHGKFKASLGYTVKVFNKIVLGM